MHDGDTQLLNGTTKRLLSYLSAAWCGITFLVLSSLLTVSISQAAHRALLETAVPEPNSADVIGQLIGSLGLGGFLVLVLSVVSGRFLLRAIPPRLHGTSRIRMAVVAILLCGGFSAILVFNVFLIILQISGTAGPQTVSGVPTVFAGQFLVSVIPVMIWIIGALWTLLRRHRNPRAFLERPYVLFLRRFSTFSDRTLIALVLRKAAPGVPVVFLTPTHSRPGDWDPFIVGFAGLKLTHPVRSVPIVLRARDADWQATAAELIRRAQLILVDASERSSALRTEAEMIDRADRWSDTVCLRNAALAFGGSLDAFERAHHIEYTKSWLRALPKLVLAVPFTLLVALFIAIPVAIGADSGLFMLSILLLGSTSYSLFWRPAIDRGAEGALEIAVRTRIATPPPRRRPESIRP